MSSEIAPSLPANKVRYSFFANALVLATSVGVLAWGLQMAYQHLTSVRSHDAVINGVLTKINAPQAGVVSQLNWTAGSPIPSGATLLSLQNPRASALEQQQIASRLQQQQATLQVSRVHLARLQALKVTAAQDAQTQLRLDITERHQLVEQVAADLTGAQAQLKLATTNFRRQQTLASQGAISQAALDAVRLELEQSQALVTSLSNRLQALRTHELAAQQGLTLDRTRSNYDPRIRLQELELQIVNQQQTIQAQIQVIQATQAELRQAQKDFQRKQSLVIRQPDSGLLWRSYVRNGEYVQQGQPLVQILDCQRRWVDVLVDEKAVRRLQPGTPASIELYGSGRQVFQGKVSTIRSGVGRLEAGEDVVVPVSENLPRHTQVRVEFAPSADQGQPGVFCYVGYTGKVTFQIN